MTSRLTLAALALCAGRIDAATIDAGGPTLFSGDHLTLGGRLTSNGTTPDDAANTNNPTLTLPGVYFFDGALGANPGVDLGDGHDFYDAYAFTVGESVGSIVTTTVRLRFNFAIDNLDQRLYSATAGSVLPLFGTPTGTVYNASGITQGGSTTAELWNIALSPGTYVLEIMGDVTGNLGGGYSGNIELAPVPLPAGLPMLLSGLTGLGILLRKRAAQRQRVVA